MAGKTILVVDDDIVIRTAVQANLKAQGYDVLTADDGNAGLALAEREAPAVVIIDLMMPRKSGLVVLETLRHGPHGGPRIIMITANEGERHEGYARSLGVDEFLRKPFPMSQLIDSVRRLCPLPEVRSD